MREVGSKAIEGKTGAQSFRACAVVSINLASGIKGVLAVRAEDTCIAVDENLAGLHIAERIR